MTRPNANRVEVDARGRTIRRWDHQGKLVQAVASNSTIEMYARLSDAPHQVKNGYMNSVGWLIRKGRQQ